MNWLVDLLPVLHNAGSIENRWPWHDPARVLFDHELLLIGPPGTASFEVDGQTYLVKGPGYIIISPATWHTCRGIWDAEVWRGWVHFDWEPGRPSLPRLFSYDFTRDDRALVREAPRGVPGELLTGRVHDFRQVRALHGRLLQACRSGSPRNLELARSALRELLVELLWESPGPEAPPSQPHRRAMKIRQHLSKIAVQPRRADFSLRDVLSRFGRSYEHLEREFRTAFGITPVQFVNCVRVERAKELLRNGDLAVQEVGAKAGFSTSASFHRVFRRVTGTSPLQYRLSAG